MCSNYYPRASYAASRYGFLLASVCVSARLSAQNLENYWSEIDVTYQENVPWRTLVKWLEVGDI